jgi:integrase/recombinase XerC
VATENALQQTSQDPKSASENTKALSERRRGRAAIDLPTSQAAILDGYAAALRSAPLSDQTRRTYTSKVRQYLAWLAAADLDEDPLTSPAGRDWAVRDYRTHLQTVLKRSPATVNNALAAVDDFYIRRGLGPASAAHIEISAAAPCALDHRAQLRYLRAVQARPSPRDQALALVPFYAGARISEIVALDIDDVARSARKGVLRILGKGERVRKVPIHPQLHAALNGWLAERADWPGANDTPALFLNHAGNGSASAARTPSSPASPQPPASTTTRPSTPSGTRSRRRSYVAAPTS